MARFEILLLLYEPKKFPGFRETGPWAAKRVNQLESGVCRASSMKAKTLLDLTL